MATVSLMRLSCTSSLPVLRLLPRPRTAITIGIAVPLPPRPSIPLLLSHRPEIAGTALHIAIPVSPLLRLHRRRPSCCSCSQNANDGEISDAPPPPPAAATSAPRRRRGRPSTRSAGNAYAFETATATQDPTAAATVSPPPALEPAPALTPSGVDREKDKNTPKVYIIPLAIMAILLLANFDPRKLKDPVFWSETVRPKTVKESIKWIFPKIFDFMLKIITMVDYAIRDMLLMKVQPKEGDTELLADNVSNEVPNKGDTESVADENASKKGNLTSSFFCGDNKLLTQFYESREKIIAIHVQRKDQLHMKYVEGITKIDQELEIELVKHASSYFSRIAES